MTVALIDGDIVAYRAACSGEQEDDFGQPGDVHLDLPSATKTADMVIRRWAEGAKARTVTVVFSGSDIFRYSVLPSYKHNRQGAEKPALYAQVVSHIETHWRTLRKPHLEADDTIGILATRDPSRYVAVSVDKDFATLPARIFNPDVNAIPKLIKPQMADRAWLMQALTGDVVDGYKGCPGTGPVNARRILDAAGWKVDAMWTAVVQQFQAAGLSEEDALVQARVARILRHTDFDTETREILLWHPRKAERLSPNQIAARAVEDPSAAVSASAPPRSKTKAPGSAKGRKRPSRRSPRRSRKEAA